MIYLLWAAVVGLAAAVLWLSFKVNALDDRLDLLVAYWVRQARLNDQVKEKLRLVGQHID